MAAKKELFPNEIDNHQDGLSYKGALASSLIFVGGGIVLVIALLLVLYITRL